MAVHSIYRIPIARDLTDWICFVNTKPMLVCVQTLTQLLFYAVTGTVLVKTCKNTYSKVEKLMHAMPIRQKQK